MALPLLIRLSVKRVSKKDAELQVENAAEAEASPVSDGEVHITAKTWWGIFVSTIDELLTELETDVIRSSRRCSACLFLASSNDNRSGRRVGCEVQCHGELSLVWYATGWLLLTEICQQYAVFVVSVQAVRSRGRRLTADDLCRNVILPGT